MSHATDTESLPTLSNPYLAPTSIPSVFGKRYLTLGLCACLAVISVLAAVWICARAVKPTDTPQSSSVSAASREERTESIQQNHAQSNWGVGMRRSPSTESPFGAWGAMGIKSDSSEATERPVD